MNLIEKATILHYHRHRIAQHQPGTIESLGWRNDNSQQARYQALMNIGDLNGKRIMDAGCGYGDLKAYLDQYYTDFDYIGVDQQPEFIAEARRRYTHMPRTQFFQADFSTTTLPQADYVFASGALGYRCGNKNYYTGMIRILSQCAEKAFGFNMLDKRHFPRHDLLIGHDREEILAFCRSLAPRVVWLNDYLPDDFTVLLYRNGQPQE